MLYFLKNKGDCTGCTACKSSCPMHCIEMVRDSNGFYYPDANLDLCIHCSICEKVCPVRKEKPVNIQLMDRQIATAAICKSQEQWEKSASGGAFGSICDAFAQKYQGKLFVYGARFNGLYVEHCGMPYPSIDEFKKSKYVQSDMKNCFQEIRDRLENGYAVLFSGTPCQVAGLRCSLGKTYENLLCVDLICHGVGSPSVFENYLKEKSIANHKEIISYTFRVKKAFLGNYTRYRSRIEYADGSVEEEVEDPYNRLFLNQLCLRESCGACCRFRTQFRWGDLTIADFNNFIRTFPEQKDSRGYSSIVANTEAGAQILRLLPEFMIVLDCDVETIIKTNPLFACTTPENPKRKEFFDDFRAGNSIVDLTKKYAPKKREPLYVWIKRHLPFSFKYAIFKNFCRIKDIEVDP